MPFLLELATSNPIVYFLRKLRIKGVFRQNSVGAFLWFRHINFSQKTWKSRSLELQYNKRKSAASGRIFPDVATLFWKFYINLFLWFLPVFMYILRGRKHSSEHQPTSPKFTTACCKFVIWKRPLFLTTISAVLYVKFNARCAYCKVKCAI